MTVHFLELARGNLRDCFDRDFPGVLSVDPGDTVIYRTLDASWGQAGVDHGGIPREVEAEAELEKGHALSGPIEVRGARPGDVLSVHVVELRPCGWGFTWAG